MSNPTAAAEGLLIDTSVVRHWGTWCELSESAQRAGVPVFVSSVTHGELLRHLRAKHGPTFSREALERNPHFAAAGRLPVDDSVAETFAASVHSAYPTSEEWNRAKQKQCHRMLHLGEKVPFEAVTSAEHCSATSDWFIAATAVHHGLLMVTQDTGPEWGICEKASVEKAKEMLAARLEGHP